jgi:hypothetical protein
MPPERLLREFNSITHQSCPSKLDAGFPSIPILQMSKEKICWSKAKRLREGESPWARYGGRVLPDELDYRVRCSILVNQKAVGLGIVGVEGHVVVKRVYSSDVALFKVLFVQPINKLTEKSMSLRRIRKCVG